MAATVPPAARRPTCACQHQRDRLFAADPAGRALAAAFVLEKAQQVERDVGHIVLVGQDHHRVRADEGAVFFQVAEIKRQDSPMEAGRMPPDAPPGR